MRTLDTYLKEEITKENFMFFLLLEFQFTTPLYFTNTEHGITYDTHSFVSKQFKIDNINYSSLLQPDSISIGISNVDLAMSASVLSEDVLNKTAILYFAVRYKSGAVEYTAVDEIFRGYVSEWSIEGDEIVKITIANELMYWSKRHLRTCSATCPWVFKGTECGYAGGQSWCDQSYDRCGELSNTANFGGFRFLPAIEEKEIWWGTVPSTATR
jgi:hypothetical protein